MRLCLTLLTILIVLGFSTNIISGGRPGILHRREIIIPTNELSKIPGSESAGSVADGPGLNDLPSGKWTLACGPNKKRGVVVDLFKVETDAGKGLTTTDVWLENRTKQLVAAVKIGWKLYEKSNPDVILLKGETPQFLAVGLSPGEKRVVTYPVVSFAKIYRPLLKGAELEGRYKIELWVSSALYDDNTISATEVQFIKVANRSAPPEEGGCQNQECDWSSPDQCYRCVNTKGSSCSWSNCSSCGNGRCAGELD
jgi:hypothetical protein